MKTAWLLVFFSMTGLHCKSSNPATVDDQTVGIECSRDIDCPGELLCHDKQCITNTGQREKGRMESGRSHSVTAEKVRQRVEKINREVDKRGQKALDL